MAANGQAKLREKQLGTLASVPNFKPDVQYASPDGSTVLGFDITTEQFIIAGWNRPLQLFRFADLVDVAIEKDGTLIQKTNRGSQVFGATAGALLLGPVGLVMGGVTGSKRSEERIRKLSLKIYVNDLGQPLHEIVFFSHPSGVDPNSFLLAPSYRQAEEWFGRFRNVQLHNQGLLGAKEAISLPVKSTDLSLSVNGE
ncbi:hypothetical protein KKP04_08720 [Rhodomicrobium sp. Az07]|uniref:hypothetical protein n=1 Tax=Rhodomicrobium sp. Az07 TaxID=2839034 RepID=UPI001BE923AD|nr:hypothetical protein [Rhodomicrobium sp. Az07]MBT3070949.1 hypothetical protein [Rhodomicrobium sp. Az07]